MYYVHTCIINNCKPVKNVISLQHSISLVLFSIPAHRTQLMTMFFVASLLLVEIVLYLVMFSATTFSGRGWFRGRDRVTEPLAWLMARDWTASAVKSATCIASTSTVYRSVW